MKLEIKNYNNLEKLNKVSGQFLSTINSTLSKFANEYMMDNKEKFKLFKEFNLPRFKFDTELIKTEDNKFILDFEAIHMESDFFNNLMGANIQEARTLESKILDKFLEILDSKEIVTCKYCGTHIEKLDEEMLFLKKHHICKNCRKVAEAEVIRARIYHDIVDEIEDENLRKINEMIDSL